MKPSVLHVVPYYPPDRIGGVGEVARVIHEGLVDRGFRSSVLTSGRTIVDSRVRRIGRGPGQFAVLSWLGVRHARRYDILHVHHGEALLLLLLLRLLRNRPRVLLMLHVDLRRLAASERPHSVDGRRFADSGIVRVWREVKRFVRGLLDRFALRCCDEVVVESSVLVSELCDLIGARRVHVVPNALSDRSRLPGHSIPHVELLYVGTPGMRKRTHLLPMILQRVRDEVPDARLRVVGFEESDDPRLEREVKRLGLAEAMIFEGRQRAEEVQAFYSAADVLVLPSAYEGMPMTLLEGMLAGLPVVATNVSGHPDAVVDGVNGFLVPLDDPTALAERCVELLMDPEARSSMGAAAAATVRGRFLVERQLEDLVSIYRGLDPEPIPGCR